MLPLLYWTGSDLAWMGLAVPFGWLDFSDGSNIASGSSDRSLCVWDAVSGRQVAALKGEAGSISALCWCPGERSVYIIYNIYRYIYTEKKNYVCVCVCVCVVCVSVCVCDLWVMADMQPCCRSLSPSCCYRYHCHHLYRKCHNTIVICAALVYFQCCIEILFLSALFCSHRPVAT